MGVGDEAVKLQTLSQFKAAISSGDPSSFYNQFLIYSPQVPDQLVTQSTQGDVTSSPYLVQLHFINVDYLVLNEPSQPLGKSCAWSSAAAFSWILDSV